MPLPIAEVLLDRGLDRPLDYHLPQHLSHLVIGTRVEVPVNTSLAKGTILSFKEQSAFKNLKSIERALNEVPLISQELFQLAGWISKYYCTPLSRVLKTMLPPSLRDETVKHKTQQFIKPLLSLNEMRTLCETLRKKACAQAKVLDVFLQNPKGLFLTQVLEQAQGSHGAIRALERKKALQIQEVRVDRTLTFEHEFFPTMPKHLNEEQQKALEGIVSTLATFQTHLIHGVTGSGKTEVYLQAIQKVLDQGKSIIYLVPEIALTSQTIERFKGRFGNAQIAVLHHRLSHGERFDAWHKIRNNEAKIIIGARSSIFSPCPDLGMIIVDEEQEASFKQSEEGPKYHARDVAIVRAKFANCPVILGSATPSIESYYNALNGKYQLHTLHSRADKARLPKVDLIDMRKEFEKAKGFVLFSDPLIARIRTRLDKGEQTLLFLNRRGYHTCAQCLRCAYTVSCPHCALNLTFHLGANSLACHLCDYRLPPPKSCPECHADGPLKFKGAGTEMVEKALHALFPQVRSLRLDADTTRHKGSHEKIFKQFRSGKADVLIGTQMIAKGLHFPLVTLVGVMGIDGSLNIPDFRASETVFQLLTQVAGRSGRSELAGEVVIQTHLPDHPLILQAANQDYTGFYTDELTVRQTFGYPPFTHLVKCTFSGNDPIRCEEKANRFRHQLIDNLPSNVEILPVVACGYAKIKERHRFQCLIKVEKITQILSKLEELSLAFRKAGNTHLSIDIDPLSTYF